MDGEKVYDKADYDNSIKISEIKQAVAEVN